MGLKMWPGRRIPKKQTVDNWAGTLSQWDRGIVCSSRENLEQLLDNHKPQCETFS